MSVATTLGGDQIQLVETARRLPEFGVQADISPELEPDLSGYDAVHLFGVPRPQEVWLQARNARSQGKPIVLSTVYCDASQFERNDRTGPVGWLARHTSADVFEALKVAGRAVNSREINRGTVALCMRGFTRMQREILEMTDTFLPNSASEWARLTRDFGLPASEERVHVVPNGVDLNVVAATPPTEVTEAAAPFADAVLCVGRVEGRKNQLRLVEALAGTDLRLVLAGPLATNQRRYVARVQ